MVGKVRTKAKESTEGQARAEDWGGLGRRVGMSKTSVDAWPEEWSQTAVSRECGIGRRLALHTSELNRRTKLHTTTSSTTTTTSATLTTVTNCCYYCTTTPAPTTTVIALLLSTTTSAGITAFPLCYVYFCYYYHFIFFLRIRLLTDISGKIRNHFDS